MLAVSYPLPRAQQDEKIRGIGQLDLLESSKPSSNPHLGRVLGPTASGFLLELFTHLTKVRIVPSCLGEKDPWSVQSPRGRSRFLWNLRF